MIVPDNPTREGDFRLAAPSYTMRPDVAAELDSLAAQVLPCSGQE